MKAMTCQILFEPVGRRVPCQEGDTIFEVAHNAGVSLPSFCGGKGTCGKCRIRVLSGQVSLLTEEERGYFCQEDIAQGYRLACLTKVQESLKIEIPAESLMISQRLQLAGTEKDIMVDPVVEAFPITLSPASREDVRSDQVRVLDKLTENYGLKDIDFDLYVSSHLPILLRANEWQAKIGLRNREMVMAGDLTDRLLGLAVDLGTTKIAAYIADLETGEVLLAKGAVNEQIAFGEDVISRISYAIENGGGILKRTAVQNLNSLIEELCADGGICSKDIVETVIVGNTAMHHLLLGLPVKQLALSPYIPAVSTPINIKARDIGLATSPSAYVHFLPNIAGFVGADHVAMLLATGIYDTYKTVLGLDIGTNTEISLATRGTLMSCSCASGPAFEGAHIKDGMRATEGAIEKVKITCSSVDIQTVGNMAPIGLCGSGILDAIAQLRESDIVDDRGKLQPHPRVCHGKGGREFILAPKEESGICRDITITERDISEIQLAKGAISAGLSILFKTAKIIWEDVDEIIIAGAFGSYLKVASAIKIGMLPPLRVERFSQVGNAAGVGARLALFSKKQRQLAEDISHNVNYVELTNHRHYPKIFSRALRL